MRSTTALVDDGRGAEPVLTDLSPAAASSSTSIDTGTTAPSTPSVTADSDAGPWTVSGTALGDDVIPTADGDLVFTDGALKTYAATLADDSAAERPVDPLEDDGALVADHDSADIVGRLKESPFNSETREIEYVAELDDPGLAYSVAQGWLDVSPRLAHTPAELLDSDDDGRLVVEGDDARRAVHLALVQSGRSPSNAVRAGALDAPRNTRDPN